MPFATVHVLDRDCDLWGYFPEGWPWAWCFPIFCREEELTSVVTEAEKARGTRVAAKKAPTGRTREIAEDASAEDLRQMLIRISNDFRDKAPLSAAQAATVILDGVRSGAWRILVGQDATMIDERIRANPEAAYDYAELFRGLMPS